MPDKLIERIKALLYNDDEIAKDVLKEIRERYSPPHIKKSHQGSYRKQTGTPEGKDIPISREKKDIHSKNPRTRRKAQFALNARKWHKGGKKVKVESTGSIAVGTGASRPTRVAPEKHDEKKYGAGAKLQKVGYAKSKPRKKVSRYGAGAELQKVGYHPSNKRLKK